MENKKKKGIFARFFDLSRDGKGVKKEPFEERNFKNFFKIYGRNLGRMFSVNLYYILGNFPLFFLLLVLSGNVNRISFSPTSSLFPVLTGAVTAAGGHTPATLALAGVHGVLQQMQVMTPLSWFFLALSLLTLLTWGPVNVGTTYILRNIVKGEPIFIWEDFWYAIKRNLKQGLIFGAIDAGIILVLAYDILFFFNNMTLSFLMSMLFYVSVGVAVIYFVMRFYIYILMITFDLSLYKILKNALIFSILGFKRNLLAVIGILLSLFLTYLLFCLFVPLGLILPFIILIGSSAFMGAYAAWPKIKEIMIDPYYTEEEKTEDEPIFHDRG